jgi:hypothetical protein
MRGISSFSRPDFTHLLEEFWRHIKKPYWRALARSVRQILRHTLWGEPLCFDKLGWRTGCSFVN